MRLPWEATVPLALITIWQIVSLTGWLPRTAMPAPTDVLVAGGKLIYSGALFRHLAVSAGRAAMGFAIGGSIGFLLGLWTGSSIWADRLFDGTVQMLRAVPHLALTPLIILWMGIGETPKIFLVALGVIFPIYINTSHAIRSVDSGLIEMGRVYGLGPRDMFQRVVFPGALPGILVGVRYALGVAWLTLIVAETISASSGIGYLAMTAREFLWTDVIVFCILIYALLGKAADSAARWLERRCLRWHPNYQPVRKREAA
jgi:sulfonate transport system permease protein